MTPDSDTHDAGAEVRARLTAVSEALARERHRTAAQSQAILQKRARALARRVETDGSAGSDAVEALFFRVGDEELGVTLGAIVAVARAGSIAPLPRATRPVYGVTAWRGRPLTALSLAAGRVVVGADTRLIVLGSGSRAALAIVVDEVLDTRPLVRSQLTPASSGPRQTYAIGVTTDGLLVVDGEALLRPENFP